MEACASSCGKLQQVYQVKGRVDRLSGGLLRGALKAQHTVPEIYICLCTDTFRQTHFESHVLCIAFDVS